MFDSTDSSLTPALLFRNLSFTTNDKIKMINLTIDFGLSTKRSDGPLLWTAIFFLIQTIANKLALCKSKTRVTSSNRRVRRLKAQVARLKAWVERLKARARRLKARFTVSSETILGTKQEFLFTWVAPVFYYWVFH